MFNEENTVEQMVLDTLCGGVTSNRVAEEPEDYPQMTQINADEKSKNNLRPSAKSADKIFLLVTSEKSADSYLWRAAN